MENAYESPPIRDEADEQPAFAPHRTKQRFLRMLLLYSAFVGVTVVIVPDNRLLDIIIGIPFLFLSIGWCHADAADRGYEIKKPTRIL